MTGTWTFSDLSLPDASKSGKRLALEKIDYEQTTYFMDAVQLHATFCCATFGKATA